MTRKIIHFAHANGFPAGTYNALFSSLSPDFEIGYLERHGHNPDFPVTDGWDRLRAELRAEIEKRYTRPIIGVGHSLGGILHFLVAIENPELYSRIILLDAPLISRLSSNALWMLKTLKLIDRYTPSRMTRLRRRSWPGREAAYLHFKQKEKFAAFDDRVVRDYVEHGLVEGQEGLELFFTPRVEASIYRTIPHNLPRFRGKLSIPADYIGGSDSREGRLARLDYMKKHFPFDFHTIEGSHLFPLENPLETAGKIREIIMRSR
jgi:pimeloyl-ACP methyl ester carboxylesterase